MGVLTARLRLGPVSLSDADAIASLVRIYRDPAVWAHLPEARPVSDQAIETRLAGNARSWAANGLDWWIVRLRGPLGGLPAGEIVGLGGVSMDGSGLDAWNLGYRLSPAAWWHGLATEIAQASLAAARETRPHTPVTARVLERNPASWRVLGKVLTVAWQGVADGDDRLTADLPRRVYTDRPLSHDMLAALIAVV
ncbi:MAG: GNAT family N-acetyltransferase [Propionibacteriaceae bacterium]|nr:GNAT family N-acetyltransferase [Propionibacteriaceae bacterium]